MKILVLSELYYPHGGGAEVATWLYSNLLSERGHEVTVLTNKFSKEPIFESIGKRIRIYRLPLFMKLGNRYDTLLNFGVLTSSFVKKLIHESDIVYIPGMWFSAIPISKLYKRPVIVHMHNYSIACPTSLMYDFANNKIGVCADKSFYMHEILERNRSKRSIITSCFMNEFVGKHHNNLGKLADAIIFVSQAQKDLVLSNAPHIKGKSYFVKNPIPPISLAETKRKGIGYFGGKDFVKGFHVLMTALRQVKRPNGAEAFLAMTVPTKPLSLTFSNNLKVNLLPRLHPSSVMQQISVVAFPSLCPEPSPYALIESMLYGKLVVASRVGGIPEIADSAVGATLLEPNNVVQLAESLDSYLSLSLANIYELGLKNRVEMLKKFDNQQSVSKLIQILEKQ